MAGLAVTFAVIWLRHSMPWAKIVSVILAVVAVVSVFFAASLWPVVIILAGIYLLYIALRPKPA
jgi:EamA domain-containing membrane protein RarD